MRDALIRIQEMTELFNERLSKVIHDNDEYLMKKLADEFKMKKLKFEDFERILNDFAACLTNVSE